jgi:glycosyltransferase involved in cell wall biosynthesis
MHPLEGRGASVSVRVLQLGKFYDPVTGGMETVLKAICENLCDRVDFQVLVANTSFRTEREVRKFPIVRAASLGRLFSMSIAPTYSSWAKKLDADLIHVHIPNPLAELSALRVDRSIPILAHFHSDIVRQKSLLKVYRPLLEAFYRRAKCIILPSPRHADVSPFVSAHRDKCRVVPFGIDLVRFDLDPEQEKKARQLRDGPPAVLCVGRLVTYKGIEFLIRAIQNLNARLWIVGSGPLESELRELIQKCNIQDRVTLLGEVTPLDLASYYHACEVFALPSVTNAEMFGIVQLEAMACRKPVVSSNLPTGVSWVNQHGVTGLLVAPASTEELTKAISTLLENRRLREEMGQAGRARVEKEFTSQKMASDLLQVYGDLLSGS